MSQQASVIVQGSGPVTKLDYGEAAAGALGLLDELADRLNAVPLTIYCLSSDEIWEDVTSEIGEPETDEQEALLWERHYARAHYHPTDEALKTLQALESFLVENEASERDRLWSQAIGFDDLLTDLRTIQRILRDAADKDQGFYIEVG